MTKLAKIKQDIASLGKADLRKLSKWLDEYKADMWDKRIKEGAEAGKLDRFVAEAKAQVLAR